MRDLAPDIAQRGVTTQQLQTEVERQIRRAGITVFSGQDASAPADRAVVAVSVTTLQHPGGLYAYAVDLAVYQAAALVRDPTPRSVATWAVGSLGMVEATNLRAISTSVRQQVDHFIAAYQAVHPRASPEGGQPAAPAPTCARCKNASRRRALRRVPPMDDSVRTRVRRSGSINSATGCRSRGSPTGRPCRRLASGNRALWFSGRPARQARPATAAVRSRVLPPTEGARERRTRAVQRSTAPRRSMRVRTMAWVALLGGLVGSARPAQPGSLARSPTVSAGRYRVTLQTPQTIFQGQETALLVGVQNAQGQPVDGVLVAFQVDARRTPYASIRPARAYTQGGRVRALVRSALLGRVRITRPGRHRDATDDTHGRHASRHGRGASRCVRRTTGGTCPAPRLQRLGGGPNLTTLECA